VTHKLALRPERRPRPASRRKRPRRGRGDGAEANSDRLRGQASTLAQFGLSCTDCDLALMPRAQGAEASCQCSFWSLGTSAHALVTYRPAPSLSSRIVVILAASGLSS
jgi:hypothetical protein